MPHLNSFGQLVGDDLAGWTPPPFPEPTRLRGRHVLLEPLTVDHSQSLFDVLGPAPTSLWTYMAMGPFTILPDVVDAIEKMRGYPDRQPFALLVGGEPQGFASYLRIDPPAGVIEVGSIVFAPPLQRTIAATEAIYLLIEHAFALGYRRCEWKCDDLNEPSRRAAERYGFRYEGTFVQATHYKGRSRDTAWYAITDKDWPDLAERYRQWLEPENFDSAGNQLRPLREIFGSGPE